MYSEWVGFVFFAFLVIWLLGLSFLLWQQNGFLRSLFPKGGERDIRRKFEEVLKQVFDLKEDLQKAKTNLTEIEQSAMKHIQRVDLLRYNPYDDTGGDQSFSIAMLDKKGNGFVVTSLHARSGTRVFAKPIELGKAVKYQMSKEEEKVVEGAMK